MLHAASWFCLFFFLFFFCTNILNNPLQRHPTPTTLLPDFCFLTPVKDRHNSGHSHGLAYVNREQNVCIIRRSSSYVFVWLYQRCVGWTHTVWIYLVIMWTKKFMNMRDEYRMIRLSLAVIVLEFPSRSDPPLPPSSHPNGACTVSPPPSLHYIFLFLPGIWKLAGVRVSAVQAYRRHKRHQHTVRCSREGGGGAEGIAKGRRKRRQKCLGQQWGSITWQRLYSKHEEKAHSCTVVNTPDRPQWAPVREPRGDLHFHGLLFSSPLPFCVHVWKGHMCVFVMICQDIFTAREASQSTAKCCDDAHLLFNRVSDEAQWIFFRRIRIRGVDL